MGEKTATHSFRHYIERLDFKQSTVALFVIDGKKTKRSTHFIVSLLFPCMSVFQSISRETCSPKQPHLLFRKDCALLALCTELPCRAASSTRWHWDGMFVTKICSSYLPRRIRIARKFRLRKQIQQYHERSTSFQDRKVAFFTSAERR